MASTLIVRKLTATSPIVIDDLGIEIIGGVGADRDLMIEQANDVSASTDLVAAINGTAPFTVPELIVLDPRDGTTVMSVADSLLAIQNHNLTHFGISGGHFNDADAPGSTFPDDYVLQYNPTTEQWTPYPHEHLFGGQSVTLGEIIAGMGVDGTDTTFVYTSTSTCLVGQAIQDETYYDGDTDFFNGTFVGGDGVGGTAYVASDTITLSDGSVVTVDAVDGNGDVTDFTVTTSGETVVTTGVALTQTSTSGTGLGFTLTPEQRNVTPGKIQWNADDAWLRNTGDTLDSGTLTIASGATVDFPTGSNITIAGDVNTATIETPGGGFVNDNDLINKFYVDSVAQGLDWKESVRIATLAGEDLTAGSFGGTYTAGGGPTATGEFTLVDLSSATGGSIDGVFFTGVAGTGLVVGDRVLIKNQADPKQNGIYEITAGPAGSATLTRAEDQDGSPASEVSGGNTVFVEDTGLGSGVNENTAWAVVFDGNVTLNTDNVDWTQTAGPGAVVAGIGISRDANTLDLDVDDLVAATPVKTDVFAFHDADGTPESSGSITRKVTFEDAFSDLGVPFDLTGTGIVVKLTEGSPDTYTTRTLAINGGGPLDGLALASPDGTAGNPTFGLNITGLPVRSDAVDTADRVAVWNSTANANEYYTIGEISTASASMSFSTWTPAGNSTGGSIVADTANDTVTVTGGPGILITTTPASDTIEWEIDISTLSAGTTVALTDEIAVDQGADPNVRFTFTDMVQDLDIVHGITSNGLIRRTANDTYEQIAIVESTTAGQEGGQVNNGGTGDTGNIEIGVDINNLGNSADDLAATDEAIIFDGTNNVSMTGQQIADGVTNILNITGLTFTDINGQSILTYIDSVRGPNKVLSIESNTYQFSDNDLDHLSWVSIGDAVDADSGHVMPLDGTIVFATAHCENTATSATKEMHVFVDGVDAGSVGLLGPGANTEITDATIDIDFLQGQKIRVQAQNGVAGRIRDTVVDLTVRWRDV